jgi:hypothetical protein
MQCWTVILDSTVAESRVGDMIGGQGVSGRTIWWKKAVEQNILEPTIVIFVKLLMS